MGRRWCSRWPVPWPLASRHWVSCPRCFWRVPQGLPGTAPRAWGMVAALVILVLDGATQWARAWWTIPAVTDPGIGHPGNALHPSLWEMGLFFLKVGAFTFGGGLTILAFIQEQVVQHLHWLTPQQFLDGVVLGRLTPGPTLILAAFVGYAVGTFWGAVVAV